MANIIDKSFFTGGQLEIAQINTAAVETTVNGYIDNLEQDFLEKLLGYELAKLFKAGYGVAGVYKDLLDGKEYTDSHGRLQKFRGLVFQSGAGNRKRSMIANYIYFYYMRQETTVTTGSGEKKIAAINAERAESINKQVRAWNEMRTWVKECVDFLIANIEDYPQYGSVFGGGYMTDSDLLGNTNLLNI